MLRRFERHILFLATYAFWVVTYFPVGSLNRHRPATVLAWDPVWRVPVWSPFLLAYISAFFMPFVVLAVMKDVRRFRRLLAAVSAVIIVSLVFFVLWPLTLPRPDIVGAGFIDRMLMSMYAVDPPANLFPSLHVSMAFIFSEAIAFERRAWRWWARAWALLIAASTLLIHQHYLMDVIGGLVMAYAAWSVWLALERKPKTDAA
jgi:membrane-associated phospholipid phosphatase